MRFIFHIGMGKTGTSSIQRALSAGERQLAAQNVRYLGMWFDDILPSSTGHKGLQGFSSANPELQARYARALVDRCKKYQSDGTIDTFICSNEAFFRRANLLKNFFETLAIDADIKFIAYLRSPRDWLPSAFTQWKISHKTNRGPIQIFPVGARDLITQYSNVGLWLDAFGSRVEFRRFDKTSDIVADFAKSIGITIPPMRKRFLERQEPAETILRAIFNNRFEDPMSPNEFQNIIVNTKHETITSIEDMLNICFSYTEIDELIDERLHLFDDIERRTGIALLTENDADAKCPPAAETVRERIIDYLIAIIVEQSLKIEDLRRLLEKESSEIANIKDQIKLLNVELRRSVDKK